MDHELLVRARAIATFQQFSLQVEQVVRERELERRCRLASPLATRRPLKGTEELVLHA